MSARRALLVGLMAAGGLLVIAPVLMPPAPVLLFNATASAPIGLYRVDRREPRVGDWVAVQPPSTLAEWMARRGYLPLNVPLLKRLAAIRGQTVCGRGGHITIDGSLVAVARQRDRQGRGLAPFHGCRQLGAGEVFLLNADAPGSFDGRYFGPLPRATIIGRATPLRLTAGGCP